MNIDELKVRRSHLQDELRSAVQACIGPFCDATGVAVTDVSIQITPVKTLSGAVQSSIVSSVSVWLDLD